MKQVVITGLGLLASTGRGVAPLANAIRRAECALAIDAELKALGMRCVLSGRVPGLEAAFAELRLDHADYFGRFSQIGAVAACDAVAAAAGAPIGRVLVASAVGPMGELEACFRDTLRAERHPQRTRAVTRVTPSFLATALAGTVGAPRGGRATSCACVSALDALRDAYELVAAGTEEAVLVGAVDEDSASAFWAFDMQRLLSASSSPETRTRALSGKAGGFVPAGGAAFFVVESETSARARGAPSLARIAGVSVRTEPRPSSLLAFPGAAYRAVLEDARAWGEPDLVLAHAPPTVADVDELEALDAAFGIARARTPVRSFKSLCGYALGAAGAIDVALGVHQLGAGEVLANDPAPLERGVTRFAASIEPVACAPARVLKVAYAQGGIAAALTLERA